MWKRFSIFKVNSFSSPPSPLFLLPCHFYSNEFIIYRIQQSSHILFNAKLTIFYVFLSCLSVYCKMRCCVNSNSPHATKCQQCKMMHWKCIDSRSKTHQNEKWTIIDRQPNQCLAFVTKYGVKRNTRAKKKREFAVSPIQCQSPIFMFMDYCNLVKRMKHRHIERIVKQFLCALFI